jgi:ubiquinone/menaquinone biosynthesis C-methylase UbiE
MFNDGLTNIINIDFSPTIVNYMNEMNRSRGLPTNYREMNILDMSAFSDGEYNIVIDKGTLDSLLCAENALLEVDKMFKEIYRVLAKDGYYICVTYGNEELRKSLFQKMEWSIYVEKIAKPNKIITSNVNPDEKDSSNFHYIYFMKK